jgi:hypothetical protein
MGHLDVEHCGDEFHNCDCTLPMDHEGPHVCSCGGSWLKVDGESDTRVYEFPQFIDPVMASILAVVVPIPDRPERGYWFDGEEY